MGTEYTISAVTKPSKDAKFTIYVDSIKELAIPPALTIGTSSNKDISYRNYLDNLLFDKDNKQRLLNCLIQLHDKALDVGEVELVCMCKYKSFHATVLKEFIEANKETLTSLLSYILPNSKNIAASNNALPDSSELSDNIGADGITSSTDMSEENKAFINQARGGGNIPFSALPKEIAECIMRNEAEASREHPSDTIEDAVVVDVDKH